MNGKAPDILISRCLAGRASDEDLVLLHRWLEESAEHRAYYAEMAAIHSAYSTLTSDTLKEETEALLVKLNDRIETEEEFLNTKDMQCRRKSRRLFLGMASACAAVLALVFMLTPAKDLFKHSEDRYMSFCNTADEVTAIVLNDGTKVWLDGGSLIRYSVDTDESERVVRLFGNAYFDVSRDTLRPFYVKTENIAVCVLGTAFSVETSGDGMRTKVILEKGSVKLQSLEGTNLVRLVPDQMAIYDAAEDDISVKSFKATPYVVENYNKVAFAGVTLKDIMHHLSGMYGVNLSASQKFDPKKRYDLNYNRTDSLAQVLDIIDALTGVRLECR